MVDVIIRLKQIYPFAPAVRCRVYAYVRAKCKNRLLIRVGEVNSETLRYAYNTQLRIYTFTDTLILLKH